MTAWVKPTWIKVTALVLTRDLGAVTPDEVLEAVGLESGAWEVRHVDTGIMHMEDATTAERIELIVTARRR